MGGANLYSLLPPGEDPVVIGRRREALRRRHFPVNHHRVLPRFPVNHRVAN